MCCCTKPSINGEPNAYSWDGKTFSTRQPVYAALKDGDELKIDLPGRCGGTDSHCHDFRIVRRGHGYALLAHNGSGDHTVDLGYDGKLGGALLSLPEPMLYWAVMRFFHVHTDAVRAAIDTANATWRKAAAEKRIKTRKQSRHNAVKVWIEPPQVAATA